MHALVQALVHALVRALSCFLHALHAHFHSLIALRVRVWLRLCVIWHALVYLISALRVCFADAFAFCVPRLAACLLARCLHY